MSERTLDEAKRDLYLRQCGLKAHTLAEAVEIQLAWDRAKLEFVLSRSFITRPHPRMPANFTEVHSGNGLHVLPIEET